MLLVEPAHVLGRDLDLGPDLLGVVEPDEVFLEFLVELFVEVVAVGGPAARATASEPPALVISLRRKSLVTPTAICWSSSLVLRWAAAYSSSLLISSMIWRSIKAVAAARNWAGSYLAARQRGVNLGENLVGVDGAAIGFGDDGADDHERAAGGVGGKGGRGGRRGEGCRGRWGGWRERRCCCHYRWRRA